MTKRELNKQEKHLIKNQLKEMSNELQNQEFLHEYATLMLNTGLEVNYNKQRKDFEQKKIACHQNITEMESAKKIIEDQLENGVEMIKEKNKEEEK